jgi:hypothetical protein
LAMVVFPPVPKSHPFPLHHVSVSVHVADNLSFSFLFMSYLRCCESARCRSIHLSAVPDLPGWVWPRVCLGNDTLWMDGIGIAVCSGCSLLDGCVWAPSLLPLGWMDINDMTLSGSRLDLFHYVLADIGLFHNPPTWIGRSSSFPFFPPPNVE